jgi:hypothetical protein
MTQNGLNNRLSDLRLQADAGGVVQCNDQMLVHYCHRSTRYSRQRKKLPAQNPQARPIVAIEAVYLVPVNAVTGTISDACCDTSLLS